MTSDDGRRDQWEQIQRRLANIERRLRRLELQGPAQQDEAVPPSQREAEQADEPAREPVHEPIHDSVKPPPAPPAWARREPKYRAKADKSPAKPARAKAKSSQSSPTLEQQIGQRWMLLAGLATLLLSGAFFFKYALDKGWIGPAARCWIGLGAGLGLLALGEWLFRRELRKFAAGLFGAGIVLLYYTAWAASPNHYALLSTSVAFGGMCGVTLLGMAVSLRSHLLLTAILAELGAFMTPLLLQTGRNEQVALLAYLLIAQAVFAALACLRRWVSPAWIAMGGVLLVTAAWLFAYQEQSPRWITAAFSAGFFAVAMGQDLTMRRLLRRWRTLEMSYTVVWAFVVAILWMVIGVRAEAVLPMIVGLMTVLLLAARIEALPALRLAALLVASVAVGLAALRYEPFVEVADQPPMLWAFWIWAIGVCITADVVTWSRLTRSGPAGNISGVMAFVAMAGVFGFTYFLLRDLWSRWMGLYTLALGLAAGGAGVMLLRRTSRKPLVESYLLQGAALVLLAVPIQFDQSPVTLAWAALAIAMLVGGKWLSSRVILGAGVVSIVAAVVHYLLHELPDDPAMGDVAIRIAGVDVVWAALLGLGLSLGLAAIVAVLLIKPFIWKQEVEETVALCAGMGAWFLPGIVVPHYLPGLTSVWLVGGMLAVLWVEAASLSHRPLRLIVGAGVGLLAGRWLVIDALGPVAAESLEPRMLVLNWQVATGLALAGACWAMRRSFRRLDPPCMPLAVGLFLLGFAAVLVAGSLEVDRFVRTRRDWLADPALALQMGLSLWWAVWAGVMLAWGFIGHDRISRYTAISIYGLTVIKALVVDMAGVETVYRVLSFLALGVLLLTGSWLYHRFFRAESAGEDT